MLFKAIKYVLNRFLLRRDVLTAHAKHFDLILRVKTKDYIGRHLYKYGVHDPNNTEYILSALEFADGDVVFDIGANIGWFSLLLAKMADKKDVHVFAFEPDPTNFALLKKNIELNTAEAVSPVQAAVADTAGTMTLHLFRDSNLGRHSMLDIFEGDSVDVDTVTLDGFWQSHHLGDRRLRFIKMDIEGFELMALRGATNMLERCPMVMLEYSPRYMRSASIEPEALLELMQNQGFIAHELVDGRLVTSDIEELKTTERHRDLYWKKDR